MKPKTTLHKFGWIVFALAGMTLWAALAMASDAFEIGKSYVVRDHTKRPLAYQFTKVPLRRGETITILEREERYGIAVHLVERESGERVPISAFVLEDALKSGLLALPQEPRPSSMAGSIIVVNESSLISAPDGSFTATIGDGKYGPELIVTGPVAERTANGERLVEAIVEIIIAGTDGGSLWSGSWPAKPGVDLDWRVAVKPYGTLDSALIARVCLRDREVSTIEARERIEREARERAEREAQQREREARQREETARVEARRREQAAEAKREAAIQAHGWPKHIEAAVIERKVMLGMTAEQARLAWGKPSNINSSVGSWGTHEQWVYDGGNYLYFEKGILKSWQTRR